MLLATVVSSLYFVVDASAHRLLLQANSGDLNTSADYSCTIKVWIEYTWNINATIESYTIQYKTISSYVRSLIEQPQFNIQNFIDQTENKQNLVYNNNYQYDDVIETWYMEMDVTSDRQLENYVNTYIEDDIIHKCDNLTVLDIISVKCEIPNDDVDITWLVVIIILTLIGIGKLCMCSICILKHLFSNNNEENEAYINDIRYTKTNSYDPFITGKYFGCYQQYGKSHPIPAFELLFVDGIVTGNGSDDIGDYNVMGIYSDETQRMALHKTYHKQNASVHTIYTVQIKVEFNKSVNMFIGDWYVRARNYQDHGSWIIQLSAPMIVGAESQLSHTTNSDADPLHNIEYPSNYQKHNILEIMENAKDAHQGFPDTMTPLEIAHRLRHQTQWEYDQFMKYVENMDNMTMNTNYTAQSTLNSNPFNPPHTNQLQQKSKSYISGNDTPSKSYVDSRTGISNANHVHILRSSPSEFVGKHKHIKHYKLVNNYSCNPFIDGIFSGYYRSNEQIFVLNAFQMRFMDGFVRGSGNGPDGNYQIEGIYSYETYTMSFNQVYTDKKIRGEYFRIELKFDESKNEFRGKWAKITSDIKTDGQLMVIARCGEQYV